MFHSAALKLTLWYLAIIMVISLVFSVSLYRVSSADLEHNVNRQIGYFNNLLDPDESLNYRQLRNRQLNEDLRHLKTSLLFFNLLVLASGGAASYWLARRTLQPIEQALDNQTRFASDASHELRTPLTAIITENEVALRHKSLTKSRSVEVIKSNLEEAIKLKALSEGLLRLTNGRKLIENPVPVDLKKIVDEIVDRYSPLAGQQKIKLRTSVKGLEVLGDKSSLTELVAIFVDNSLKYTPAGGKIDISAKRQHKQIALKIADTGQGIKASDLPRIFERFYRADASRHKDTAGGYGLGLSIAKKIAQAHHGHIEVASTLGQGTVFTIILPAA